MANNLFNFLSTPCITPNVKSNAALLTNHIDSSISYTYSFFKKMIMISCRKFHSVFSPSRALMMLTFAAWSVGSAVNAQGDITRFYYPDGTVSSEGMMRNGKPDGYWKTFYPTGILKTEGNRKNFELDSTWNFYREDGTRERMISYREGLKNGIEQEFDKKGKLTTEWTNENNIRQGPARSFYDSGELWKSWQFVNNKEEGKMLEYAKDGRIITVITYRNGFIYASEKINRYDDEGNRIGPWRELYANQQIKEEGNWTAGKRNGVFKFYDKRGLLERIERYVMGELVNDNGDDTSVLDIRREYDEMGRVRSVGSYRDGKKHGTFRFFSETGQEEPAMIYDAGTVTGLGLIDSLNRRQGPWKLFYPDGELRAEGNYLNGMKDGTWSFFYRTGKLEQKGNYKEDLPVGNWKWLFSDGSIHREENYRRGKEDGHAIEYDSTGKVINEGDYIDGLKSGMWMLTINDHTEKGEYVDGEKNGVWTWYYDNGNRAFEGEFALGVPVGRHRYWYFNGIVKMKGDYEGGELNGTWQYFDESGMLQVETEYEQGKAIRMNGQKIKLPESSDEQGQ